MLVCWDVFNYGNYGCSIFRQKSSMVSQIIQILDKDYGTDCQESKAHPSKSQHATYATIPITTQQSYVDVLG